MQSIFNFIKSVESKLTQSEIPELQFLQIDNYKSDSFNIHTFMNAIMNKLKDTNYLISQLKLTMDFLKNEIVEQINSNFGNYVTLISKLQTIDFLIENIEKPLQNIKKKIISEIHFVEKYEQELKGILNFIQENDSHMESVKLSLSFYKLYSKSQEILKDMNSIFDNGNVIGNIVANHPDEFFLTGGNYDSIRKYFIFMLRFCNVAKQFYEVYQRFFKEESEQNLKMMNEIKQEEEKHMINVDEILKILVSEYLGDAGNLSQMTKTLMLNLFSLIFQIYSIPQNETMLFNKILDFNLIGEINTIFEREKKENEKANSTLIPKIEELTALIKSKKYLTLNDTFTSKNCKKPKNFQITCFLLPLINKVSQDKFIFNCADPQVFKDNYNCIANFFSKFITVNNFETIFNEDPKNTTTENEGSVSNKIKTFAHSFSFFTFFQYVQNEISKLFMEDMTKNTNSSLESDANTNAIVSSDNYIITILTEQTNFIFNYTKVIVELFRDRKIFLKILPNFLTFITQCNKYIIKKQSVMLQQEYFAKLTLLAGSKIEQSKLFSFEESNMTGIKKAIVDYLNILNNYINYFTSEGANEMSVSFYSSLYKLPEREIFLFRNQKDFEEVKQKIDEGRILMKRYIVTELNYFKEGEFLREMLSNAEISKEIKIKIS